MQKNVFLSFVVTLLLITSSIGLANGTQDLDVLIDDQSIQKTETVTVDAILTNNGDEDINGITATVSRVNAGSSSDVKNTFKFTIPSSKINLGPQESQTLSFGVEPRTTASLGDNSITLTFKDSSGNTVATQTFTVDVSEIPSDESLILLDESDIEIDVIEMNVLREGSATETIKVKNQGSRSFNLEVTPDVIVTDEDGNKISLSVSPSNTFTLSPGSEKTIDITASVAHDRQEIRTYSGFILVSSPIDADAAVEADIVIDVQPNLCDEAGIVGEDDLRISIEEPESDDEFKIGDTIDLEINVDNRASDDKRIKVEAFLYSGDNEVDQDEDTTRLDENEDEDIDLSLYIDPDEDVDVDDLTIYIKAYERGSEDLICNQIRQGLDIETEDDELLVTDVSISPLGMVDPGALMTVRATIFNIGEEEQENVYMRVVEQTLGIDESSSTFLLKEYGNDDESKLTTFLTVRIPDDAKPGEYVFTVEGVIPGESPASVFTEEFTVADVGQTKVLEESVSIIDSSPVAAPGKEFSYVLTIINPSDKSKSYQVEFVPTGDWAQKGIAFETVSAEDSKTIEVTSIMAEDTAQAGSGFIRVSSNGDLIETISVSAELEGDFNNDGQVVTSEDSFFSDTTNVLLVAGIILLAILVIILFVIVLRQQSKGYYLPPK